MDLKALIAKMDQIESKRFLTEGEDREPAKKKETSWTDKSGKKHPATQVQGHQSRKADKEADKESKRKDEGIVFKSGIAQELLREFNLEEADFQFSPEQEKWLGGSDRQDPYILARMPGPKPPASYFTDPESQAIVKQRFSKVFTGAPAATGTTRGGAPVTSGSGAPVQSGTGGAVTSGTPAPATGGQQAASPAKPAAPAGTPAGGVDDEGNIMPGFTTDENGNVVKAGDANFVEPATQKLAQQGRQAAKEKEYAANADAEDQAMGQAMAANAAGGPSSVNAQGQNVTMPDGTNPETGEKTQTATAAAPATSAPLQLPPGAAPEPGMTVAGGDKPAGGQAASPAAGGGAAWVKKLSPSTFAQATQLGLLQNGKPVDAAIKKFQKDNGLKDDGIIGPQTTIAIVSAANLDKSGKGGRGGQGGPTADELARYKAQTQGGAKPATAAAPAKPAGQQAASPSGNVPAMPDPNRRTGTMAQRDEWMAKYGKTHNMDGTPKTGGQAASPAKPLPGKAVPGGGNISDTPAAESVDYSDINRLLTLALWR